MHHLRPVADLVTLADAFQAALSRAGSSGLALDTDGALLADTFGRLTPPGQSVGGLMLRLVSELPPECLSVGPEFNRRLELEYEIRSTRPSSALTYAPGDESFRLEPVLAGETVRRANDLLFGIELFTRDLQVPISELLGLRNLSSLVSAVVVSALHQVDPERLMVNPHQDGYPDLLPRTKEFIDYADAVRREGRWSDKAAWTSSEFGGVEVKATNGGTPAAKKIPKRGIGEERSDIITGFDWKAHHQETDKLLGCTWDFVDTVPTITALFWRNDLQESDWGGIVKPRVGGGRTTSVSIMNRNGLSKMAEGWLVRPLDDRLRRALQTGRLWA